MVPKLMFYLKVETHIESLVLQRLRLSFLITNLFKFVWTLLPRVYALHVGGNSSHFNFARPEWLLFLIWK